MKLKNGFGICVFAAAAVLIGFFLPKLSAAYQEKRILTEIHSYESETVRFPSSYHVLDCMQLLSSGYERVDLEEGKKHSQEQIEEIAQDVLTKLDDYRYIWPGQGKMTKKQITAFLAVKSEASGTSVVVNRDTMEHITVDKKVSEQSTGTVSKQSAGAVSEQSTGAVSEQSAGEILVQPSEEDSVQQPAGGAAEEEIFSAIIWQCNFSDEDGNYIQMFIDDMSGKMISVLYRCPNRLRSYSSDVANKYLELFENSFPEFVNEYYGAADTQADIVYEGENGFYYTLTIRDRSDSAANLLIRFSDSYWEFNPILER